MQAVRNLGRRNNFRHPYWAAYTKYSWSVVQEESLEGICIFHTSQKNLRQPASYLSHSWLIVILATNALFTTGTPRSEVIHCHLAFTLQWISSDLLSTLTSYIAHLSIPVQQELTKSVDCDVFRTFRETFRILPAYSDRINLRVIYASILQISSQKSHATCTLLLLPSIQ